MKRSEAALSHVLCILLIGGFYVAELLRLLIRLLVALLLLPLLPLALPWAMLYYRQRGIRPPWRRWRMRCPACDHRGFTLLNETSPWFMASFRCKSCDALLDADGNLLAVPEPARRGTRLDTTGFTMAWLTLREWPVGEFRERRDILARIVSPHASAFGASRALVQRL